MNVSIERHIKYVKDIGLMSILLLVHALIIYHVDHIINIHIDILLSHSNNKKFIVEQIIVIPNSVKKSYIPIEFYLVTRYSKTSIYVHELFRFELILVRCCFDLE